jgi:Ca-activated chloride channel homolog
MMGIWEQFEWVHPWRLLALALPIVLFLLRHYGFAGRPVYFAGTDWDGWRAPFSVRMVLRRLAPWLLYLALAFLVIAWARPRHTLQEEEVKAEGIDIFLAMDLSSSMLARDFEPDRLTASKYVAAQFVDKRIHDRIGLTVFAGEAFTQCPLTTDHKVVKEFLAGLECGTLEDGTAIGMGLASALNRLKDSEAKSKVVILITDGVNNAGYIQPLTAAGIAQSLNVRVYAIGVGTEGQALTPVARARDGTYRYGMAHVQIDEALLREITSMTGGRYYRATSEAALQSIYDEIDTLEKTEMQVTVIKRYSEAFRPWLLAGLVLLVLELLIQFIFIRQPGM